MKPSERIKEIAMENLEKHKKECFQHGFEPCGYHFREARNDAIVDFLDEENKKDSPDSGREDKK